MTTRARRLNAALKSWPSWVLMLLASVSLLAVGVAREGGPQTQQERIDGITRRLACPTCDGESVYVSQASAAENIRDEVARQVATGVLDDDGIVAYIESRFGGRVLLVPRASGVDALVWALPVAVLVCALAGLAAAFRRWDRQTSVRATDEDERLVAGMLGSTAAADTTDARS